MPITWYVSVCDGALARYRSIEGIPSYSQLTDQEFRVLFYVSYGFTAKTTGSIINLAADTVKSHRKQIYLKFAARNASHAVGIAFRNGWMI